MSRYIFRRLTQAFFTVFGVMFLTFVLFRVVAGDVSSAYVNQKLGMEARQAFYEKHKLDRPGFFNFHQRLVIIDHTTGSHLFSVKDSKGSLLAKQLNLHIAPSETSPTPATQKPSMKIISHLLFAPNGFTSLQKMTKGATTTVKDTEQTPPSLLITASDGTALTIPLQKIKTAGDLIEKINNHPDNQGKISAGFSGWSLGKLFDTQFFWHLYENITFTGRSYATDQTLFEIIAERGKFSLALSIPALALGWFLAMVISFFVAYYRDTPIDRVGVFLAVLGMCIPYLAYMLIGQAVMFKVAPSIAVGLSHPASIFAPVFISVIAGVGVSVRFYRTIILDQINQDYVRTARAKGVGLPTILFVHVLKNCMLPILTNLISAIPFLIMGSLLLERFFGIPGLGDLMLSSITSRDVPIITGLTFMTSALYILSLLVTDILYAVFDPRIRLQ
jgi:peptide/nickel transport system permease protein